MVVKRRRQVIDVDARVTSTTRTPAPSQITAALPPERGRIVGLSDDGAYELASGPIADVLGVRDPLGRALLGVVGVVLNPRPKLARVPASAPPKRTRRRRALPAKPTR